VTLGSHDGFSTGAALQHEYRGHQIRLIEAEQWSAEVIELASGVALPTMITATPDENLREVSARARRLVDTYVDAQVRTRHWVIGPARPWQTILS
jgi:hypothetical protein